MSDSLEWVFKKEFLEDLSSPRFVKCSLAKEKENRFKTIWFMKDLSNALRPPPRDKAEETDFDIRNLRVFWTACVFFHRFYVFHSFDSQPRFAVAIACLFLAAKVEEKPLRLGDHVVLYHRVRFNKKVKKGDAEYLKTEKEVLVSERILLQTLNFDLNVTHPHQYFKQIIGRELKNWFADTDDSKQVMRLATSLSSDSLRSMLCLQYSPHQIAYALVFLALIILQLNPTPPTTMSSSGSSSYHHHRSSGIHSSNGGIVAASWVELFEKEIDENILQSICNFMVDLYAEGHLHPEDRPVIADCQLAKQHIACNIEALRVKRQKIINTAAAAVESSSNNNQVLATISKNIQNNNSCNSNSLTNVVVGNNTSSTADIFRNIETAIEVVYTGSNEQKGFERKEEEDINKSNAHTAVAVSMSSGNKLLSMPQPIHRSVSGSSSSSSSNSINSNNIIMPPPPLPLSGGIFNNNVALNKAAMVQPCSANSTTTSLVMCAAPSSSSNHIATTNATTTIQQQQSSHYHHPFINNINSPQQQPSQLLYLSSAQQQPTEVAAVQAATPLGCTSPMSSTYSSFSQLNASSYQINPVSRTNSTDFNQTNNSSGSSAAVSGGLISASSTPIIATTVGSNSVVCGDYSNSGSSYNSHSIEPPLTPASMYSCSATPSFDHLPHPSAGIIAADTVWNNVNIITDSSNTNAVTGAAGNVLTSAYQVYKKPRMDY